MQSLHILDSSLSYPGADQLDSSISSQWNTPYSPFSPSPGPAEVPLESLALPRDYFQPLGVGVGLGSQYMTSRPHDYTYVPYYNYNCKPTFPLNVYASPLTEIVGNPGPHLPDHLPIDFKGVDFKGVDFGPREVEFPPQDQAPFQNRLRQKVPPPIREGPRLESPPCIKSEFFNLDSPANLEDMDLDRENDSGVNRPQDEQCSLSSFREALGVMQQRNTPSTTSSSSPDIPFRPNCHIPLQSTETVGTMGLGLTTSKQEEVLKAAKSLFSKRTRTLYQWLCPDASKTKLKASVTAAWDTLSEPEKHFYISQVLGRFGLRESSLMVNPQLDGIKGLPGDSIKHSMRASICKARAAIEDQEAVNALFDSCDDAHSWTSFRRQKKLRAPRNKTAPPPEKEKRKKRKYVRRNPSIPGGGPPGGRRPPKALKTPKQEPEPEPEEEGEDCGGGGDADRDVRVRVDADGPGDQLANDDGDDGDADGEADADADADLRSDAENMAVDEEFWNNPLNPAELFPEINF